MRTAQLIVLIPFTLLIIYDFFPNLIEVVKFPAHNLKLVLVLLLVVSLILPNAKSKKGDSRKGNFFPFLYFFVLFLILTLLGGESQSGLVDPYFIGIFLLLLFLELIKYFKFKKKVGNTFNS